MRLLNGTRIQVVCPCTSPAQEYAAQRVVDHLLHHRQVQRWGGLTYTCAATPEFIGAFWHGQQQTWEVERATLLFVDAPEASPYACQQFAVYLHDLVAAIYDACGAPQEQIWVTTHPLALARPPVWAAQEPEP